MPDTFHLNAGGTGAQVWEAAADATATSPMGIAVQRAVRDVLRHCNETESISVSARAEQATDGAFHVSLVITAVPAFKAGAAARTAQAGATDAGPGGAGSTTDSTSESTTQGDDMARGSSGSSSGGKGGNTSRTRAGAKPATKTGTKTNTGGRGDNVGTQPAGAPRGTKPSGGAEGETGHNQGEGSKAPGAGE